MYDGTGGGLYSGIVDILIRKYSGPWEMHLPGNQNAFTAVVNAAGLRSLAELLKKNNHEDYQKYFYGVARLKNGIEQNLFYEGKLIKGFYEANRRRLSVFTTAAHSMHLHRM